MKVNYSTLALSVTNLILRLFLQGLIPVYPFIIAKMSTGSSAVGVFLSLNYIFLFLGTYLTGIIVPKYFNPKFILLGSVLPIVCLLSAYGIINDLRLFDICGCVLSFFLGLHVCSNNILMGYYSSEKSAGKNFSTLSISSLLATVLGGFIVGPLLLSIGFKQAFIVFAFIILLFSFSLIPLAKPEIQIKARIRGHFKIDKKLWLLLVFNFLISFLIYGFKLIVSVMLRKRGWDVSNVSTMMAVGSSFAIPITLWWGKTSNYGKAIRLLISTIASAFIAYTSLFGSGTYFFGLLGFACISVVAYSITIPLMSVFFEWYDHQSLPKAQALLNSSIWASAITSFLYNGYALEHFSEPTCIVSGLTIASLALIPLIALKMQLNRIRASIDRV